MHRRRNPLRNPRANGKAFKAGVCFAILLFASACQNADKNDAARAEGGASPKIHATDGARSMADQDAWYQRAIRIPTVQPDPAWKRINRVWPNADWTVQNERAGWTVRIQSIDYLEHLVAVDFLDANDKMAKGYVIKVIQNFSKSKMQRTFRIMQISVYANRKSKILSLEYELNDGSNIDVGILAKVISMMSIQYGLQQDQYEILYDAPRKGEYA